MKIHLSFLFACLISISGTAQITSTFDTDADGWAFSNNGTPVIVNHNASNGNPGGFAATVPYSSNATTTTQGWFAPSKFLGLQAARSFGMNLKFDLQQSSAGTASSGQGDVRIRTTSSLVIVYSLPVKPAVAPAWSSYTIKLDETAGWRVGGTGGALATRAEIIQALSNILELEIRGTYITAANNVSGLDNVILEQKTLAIAPAVTSLSAATGKTGDVITINGSGFNTVAANNTVRFGTGGIKAVVQSASSTQITIVVPQNASYGPIVVTNTTTGLTTITDPFTPVFDGGGRIIPSSFKPKFDIPTIQIESIAVADIDGDGWNDLVVTNDFTDRVIDIYRNLGAGGTLSASSFDAKVSIAYTGVNVNDTGLWFADLDGDGKPDAITSNFSVYGVYVTFRNTSTPGNISFEAPEYWRAASDESPIKYIGDLDGDGRPDLVSGEGAMPGAFWFNQNLSVPGDIEIGGAIAPFALTVINGFTNATAGDLNGDGKPELIITNGQGTVVDILQNTSTPGSPLFIEAFQIVVGHQAVLIADMNLDGKNDLIYKSGTGFRIRLNTDTDGMLTASDFATDLIITGDLSGTIIGGITLADMNGDGKPDIVESDNTDFGVYENVFSGGVFDVTSLVPAYQYEAPGLNTAPTVPVAVDLNGDGKPEIIAGITNAGTPDKFTIYENVNIHSPIISLNTVSPLSGAVGSTVTITGSNFSTVPSENTVWFGTVKATVLTATANQITVTVPAGASYAAVSVTKDELTSKYHLPFQPTFSTGVTFDNTHFAPPVEFTLTGADYDVTIGDLDNDGLPDVVAEGGTAATTRFRNTHTSGPINTSSLSDNGTSANIRSPRLQDLDGDGKLDLMGVSTISRNNSTTGNISFLPNINLPVDQLGLADFSDVNQDGKTDILIVEQSLAANIIENQTANLTGNFTTGTFASFQRSLITRLTSRGSVVGADFDNDGYADMITSNFTLDNISIYKNGKRYRANATSFEVSVELNVGDNPQRMYTGDFDRDGKLDVLVLHGAGTTSTLLVLLQNTSTVGNISFSRIDLTNPSASTTAAVADLDGDGRPEIITTSESGNRFSIFKNIHTGGPLTAASFAAPFNTTVTAPRGITTGDLNLDGKPEIILTRAAGLLVVYENFISSFSPPTITSFTPATGAVGTTVTITGTNFSTTPANNIVYFGATKATVTAATSTQLTVIVPSGTTHKPISVAVNGLTAQSRLMFITTFTGETLSSCSFAPKVDFATANAPTSVWLHDLNTDGNPDIITTNKNSNTVSVLLANGTGGFNLKTDYVTGSTPYYLAIGDLNGDGKPDLIVTNDNPSLPPNYISVLLGNGDGTFASKTDFLVGVSPQSLALGDLNLDGKLDVIVANSNETTVSVLLGTGNGSLAPKTNYTVLFGTTDVAVLDANKDSKPDIVVLNYFNNTLSILLGDGSGGLGAKTDFATGVGPVNLALADLNGDGNTDLITSNVNANTISVLFGNGTGGFLPKTDYASGINPRHVAVSDLNGDGLVDVSVVNSTSNTISVYQGSGTGTLSSKIDFPTGLSPTGLTCGDINSDNKPELILTNTSDNTVSILNNLVATPPPIITSFTPTIGMVGVSVTITGLNFISPLPTAVFFNGISATITNSTATSLIVAVPTGATTGKITITIGCNTATSVADFTIGTVVNDPPIIQPVVTAAQIDGIVTIDLLPLISD
ncbi:MAG: hypothetical protein E6Q41_04105, partial [Cyclobacteriaceae bacterium]